MKTVLAILFTFLTGYSVCSQSSQLAEAKGLVDSLFRINGDSALVISEQMLPLAYESGDTLFISYFLDQAGELNRRAGNFEKAIRQLQHALIYKVNWDDLKDLSITYNNLGKTYLKKGHYDSAALHFLEALRLMETAENLLGQSFYLNNLGAVYDLQQDYSSAITYFTRSLRIKEELGDSAAIAAGNVNLGILYFNLEDYDRAVVHQEKSISYYRVLNLPTKYCRAMANLGQTYLTIDRLDSARKYLYAAYDLKGQLAEQTTLTTLINNLSNYHMKSGDVKSALEFNDIALQMARKQDGFKHLMEVYEIRSEIYQQSGRFSEAYHCLLKSHDYQDSLINETNTYALAEMKERYETERNQRILQQTKLERAEAENELKEKRLFVIQLIVFMIVLIGVAVFLFVQFRNKKKQNGLLEGQMKLIATKNRDLDAINAEVTRQLNNLQISLTEKEEILEKVFTRSQETELPPQLKSLSQRETEVLAYLSLGWSDDQLADRLYVSKSTIKTHLRRVYSKLLVRGRAEAVALAHKYDLIGGIEV